MLFLVAISTFAYIRRIVHIADKRLKMNIISFLIVEFRRNRRVVEFANCVRFREIHVLFIFEIAIFRRFKFVILIKIFETKIVYACNSRNELDTRFEYVDEFYNYLINADFQTIQ